MSNRIRDVQATQRRWDAAEAELWITVTPEQLTPTTELRGRLVGPRCPGVSTVEVAYPLRPLPRSDDSPAALTARVIIPDPLPGEMSRPYFYEGPVELWQDGQKCDEAPVRVMGKVSTAARRNEPDGRE
jgi:hypothetical protein